VPSTPDDYIDPRLLERVDLGDGRWVTVRRGAVGLVLAGEAESLVQAYAGVPGDASYLGREVEIACSSVKRGTDAVFVSEWFTGWLFTRHIAESAIRAAWVAKGDDGPAVNERLRRLEKRDWKLLLSADKAIVEEVGRGMIANREEVLTFEPGMAAQHAPLDLRGLASEAGEPGIYEIWRWASVLVHPGFSNYLHSVDLYKGEAVLRALHMSFATLTYAARTAFGKLAPDLEAPDVSATIAALRAGGLIDFGQAPKPDRDTEGKEPT
jgi:hypothetical protein